MTFFRTYPTHLSQEHGIRLFTCHVRRGRPDTQDPAWNSHSKLNCIAACIQVIRLNAVKHGGF